MRRRTREPDPDDFDREIMTLREVADYLNCQVLSELGQQASQNADRSLPKRL